MTCSCWKHGEYHDTCYRLPVVYSSSLSAQYCVDCSRVLYTPLLHCLCYRTTRERRRAGSSREESAQRVSDTPQRHKRERSLCENHHVKRKNYRASQQRAVRSVNVCTGLVTSHICSCQIKPVFFHLLGLLSRPDSSVVLLTVQGW